MSRLEQVTISEFLWLLTKAQKEHIEHGEPIPSINKEGQGKIEYCLQAPFAGIEDEDFHKTFDDKAAILFYDICKLHCLLNGNKRMAVETTIFFAWKNNRYCYINKAVLKDMAIKIVESDANDKEEVVWWVSRVFFGGLRIMSRWRKTKMFIKFLPKIIYIVFIKQFYRGKLVSNNIKIIYHKIKILILKSRIKRLKNKKSNIKKEAPTQSQG